MGAVAIRVKGGAINSGRGKMAALPPRDLRRQGSGATQTKDSARLNLFMWVGQVTGVDVSGHVRYTDD